MIRRFFILCLLPCCGYGAVRGWMYRILLSPFVSVAQQLEDGRINYHAAYTDANDDYYFWFYQPNPSYPQYSPPPASPYRANYDLDGNTPPQPPTSEYTYYIVQSDNLVVEINDSNGADLSPIGDLDNAHGVGPSYQSSLGNILNHDHNVYTGVNGSFNPSAITPLQGFQSGDSPSIYYGSDGMIHSGSDTQAQDGYKYEQDGGSWKLTPYKSGTTTGDYIVQLNTIISNQDLQRQQLVQLLGSAGNSWVYDCKLSLAELSSLASSLQLDVSSIRADVSSINTTVNSGFSSVANALGNLHDDNQSLMFWIQDGSDRTESAISSAAGDIVNAISLSSSPSRDYTSQLTDIKGVLDTIRDNTSATADDFLNLPQPIIPSDNPDDDIPLTGWRDTLYSRAQFSFGQMVSWGSSPSIPLGSQRFDFLSRLLTRMVGTIPSVGSDPHMFDVDFDLPYVGRIQKSFSFADWPSIPLFRTAMLWVLYLFFALAFARLIFDTFI